jgi:CRP-like cAMP-binding protein
MGSFNFEQRQTGAGLTTRPILNGGGVSVESIERPILKREPLQQPAENISANHILRQMPVGLLRKLQPHTRKVVFKGGEYIYRPDEDVDWIFFPETTAISELQILEDGRTIEVSLTGREGAVGIPTLFGPGLSTNWVQVCTPGTSIKIKRDVLRKETRGMEWANGLFHSAIQDYIAQISQKVACNAHHSVEERFSTWLLMLQDRCPVQRLKLTQEHIARVLGVYRPSITCIAQEMRESGLIDYVRGNIVIANREGLKKRSCSCYVDPFHQANDLKFANMKTGRPTIL